MSSTIESGRIAARPRLRSGRSRAALGRSSRVLGIAFRRSIAIVLFLAAWEVLPRVGVVDPTFLTPFSDVLEAARKLVADGSLWTNTRTSLVRAGTGFGIALVIAIPLGLLIGWYARVAELVNPLLELFRNTAVLALLPVFVLILGIGETSKIGIVVYACVFPIVLNTITGVRGVDPLLVKSARSMGLGSLALFWKVILPAAVPTIFTGIRMAGAAAILVLVAAEMVGAKAGLGFLITYSQNNFQIPDMYAGILVIAIIGVTVNGALLALERRFSRWRQTA